MRNTLTSRTTPKVIAEIRAEMARQAVTQTELASRVHMTLAALRRRLSGEAPLLVAELLDIAEQLDVPPANLLAGQNNASAGPVGTSARGPNPTTASQPKE